MVKKLCYTHARVLISGLTCFSLFFIPSTYASSIQRFQGLGFDNPARLSLVKKDQVVLDYAWAKADLSFVGRSRGQNGIANGNGSLSLPYGRYAHRFNKKVVVGLDINDPFSFEQDFPNTSIVRYVVTYLKFNSTDISPNLSLSLSDKVSVGVGFDAVHSILDLHSMVPSAIGDLPFLNNSSGWGYGWHSGILFKIASKFFAGLTYYSPISFKESGISTLSSFIATNWSVKVTTPATILMNFSAIVNPKITLGGGISYSMWNINTIYFNNTAIGNIPFAFNFRNTWRISGFGSYALNSKWGLRGGLGLDQGPTNNRDRSLLAPTADTFLLGMGVHYQVVPSVGLDLDYGHIFFWNAGINNIPTQTFGRFHSRANALEGRLTWNF